MGTANSIESRASLRKELSREGVLTLLVEKRLDADTTGALWRETKGLPAQAGVKKVVVDASKVDYCDGAGIGFLFDLKRQAAAAGKAFEIRGLKEDFARLLDQFDPAEFETAPPQKRFFLDLFVEIGRLAVGLWHDLRDLITFQGELFCALLSAFLHPRRTRWKDAFHAAEKTGVNALPIIALVSFLIGLVMAFQSAIPMSRFGAEVYVSNLIAFSMFRELGPLLTAILLAGRSGSAFAAELGTMKINEEVDALNTMGLDPVRFLVVTRVTATVFITPLLTVFANFFGVVGGAVVMKSLGFPLVVYVHTILQYVDYVDLLSGLLKAVAFGLIVAAVGCLEGLRTKTGASGVGESTTSAVVSGIVLIIITDGIFSVLYFYLGI
jgi:phospholipid/cholesterol/gamma-HCH transport system permease protein